MELRGTMRMPLEQREYALYRADEFIMIGSMQEIMDYAQITRDYFQTCKAPSHSKRAYKKGVGNTWIIVDFYVLDQIEERLKKQAGTRGEEKECVID